MNYNHYMPTKIVSGKDAVKNNSALFALGKKCFIVCGRNSAKACGALDDVTAVLDSLGIGYEIYNRITENPLVSICYDGGKLASGFGADFVVAIGGGSPLDASKAIAAYAANPDMEPLDIYGDIKNHPLPIIAIPTTAGTGSEVNYYSVLTIDGKNVKKTYKNQYSYPKYAILDSKYTESLGLNYTVSTALDAFCHCIEAYLSPKANEISRMFAVSGAAKLYRVIGELYKLDDGDGVLDAMKPYREDLLTASCAGGITINAAGTGFNHPLGYNLTLYKGIPHGRACGAFMEEYVAYNMKHPDGKRLIEEFVSAICDDTPEVMAANIVKWSAVNVKLTDEEIALYVENVKGAGNYANSPYVINDGEKKDIYEKLFK